MNKAAIFDLDGTLIDSLPDILDNVNLMLAHYGYEQTTAAETMQRIGNGARNLVKNSIPESISEEALDERLAFYNEKYTSSGSPKTGVFDGVPEMLRELKKRGYKLAILTNKPHETTQNVYDTYLKNLGFDLVVGASSKFKHKPCPDALLDMLKRLDVAAENAWFIGDGEADVKVALNASVKGVAVLWGYRTKAQLLEAGATVFANAPGDLLSVLI